MKMNRSSQYLLLFSFLLINCDKDDLGEKEKGISLADVKFSLVLADRQNNLVTKIEFNETNYAVHFEEGDAIVISSSFIKKIEHDSTAWMLTFLFTDGSEINAHFLGKLRITRDQIIIDPFLTCPLCAIAEVEMPVKGRFQIIVHGKADKGVTITKTFNTSTDHHTLPILGLYEDFTNNVEFVFLTLNGEVRCSQVVVVPTPGIADKPSPDIKIAKNLLSEEYNGLYFISNLKAAFDQAGDLRWFYNGDGSLFFGKLRNGNFIVTLSDNRYFHEVSMTGQLVKKFFVPNALHHEIVELPSGNLLVATHSPPGSPYEDVVIEIGRKSGEVVKTWDFNLILDSLRPTLPSTQPGDWLHINAMYFDADDNSIVISGRSQSAVVKIDYSTGSLKWILGNHNAWDTVFVPFLLNPVDNQGNKIDVSTMDFWPYGQHAIHRLPNGNILLYDNGDYRGFYDDPKVPQASYTRIVEYRIDEPAKTVELVWQFDNNKSVFTKFTGYTQNLNNTRLAAYMWVSENTPKIVEVNSNDQIVYEATINRAKATYYRTIKVDIYGGI